MEFFQVFLKICAGLIGMNFAIQFILSNTIRVDDRSYLWTVYYGLASAVLLTVAYTL
jgi:hypothetical protein